MLHPFKKKKIDIRNGSFYSNRGNPNIIKVFIHCGGKLGKKTSNALLCICLYHDDHHPSLALYPETNRFFCFACGVKGNSYQLLKDKYGLTFKEAVAYAKERGLYDD